MFAFNLRAPIALFISCLRFIHYCNFHFHFFYLQAICAFVYQDFLFDFCHTAFPSFLAFPRAFAAALTRSRCRLLCTSGVDWRCPTRVNAEISSWKWVSFVRESRSNLMDRHKVVLPKYVLYGIDLLAS